MSTTASRSINPPGFHLVFDRDYRVTATVVHGMKRYHRQNSQTLQEIETLIESWVERYGLLFCVESISHDKRLATQTIMDRVLDEAIGDQEVESTSLRNIDVMTPSDAGKMLGVSGRTVRRWITELGVDCPKTGGGLYRIPSDIVDILEEKYGKRVQHLSSVQDVRPNEKREAPTSSNSTAMSKQGFASKIVGVVKSFSKKFATVWGGGVALTAKGSDEN